MKDGSCPASREALASAVLGGVLPVDLSRELGSEGRSWRASSRTFLARRAARARAWSAALVVLVGGGVYAAIGLAAAQDWREYRDRFELFNGCRPIGLLVETPSDDAAEIGLTRERLQTVAESRLRAARLYDGGTDYPHLYINVHVVGRAFHSRLNFYRPVDEPVSGLRGVAGTWERSSTGTNSDAGDIVQDVSEHLDAFILDYLRVNEGSC